jgi:hypothetical protein
VNTKADEGREFLKRLVARLVDRNNEFVECGKRVVKEQKESVTSAVETGKTAYLKGW